MQAILSAWYKFPHIFAKIWANPRIHKPGQIIYVNFSKISVWWIREFKHSRICQRSRMPRNKWTANTSIRRFTVLFHTTRRNTAQYLQINKYNKTSYRTFLSPYISIYCRCVTSGEPHTSLATASWNNCNGQKQSEQNHFAKGV